MKTVRGAVLAIGVFDGVHIGHRRIIEKVVARARRLGIESVVVTFDPHPLKVLKHIKRAPSLISLDHRIRLIESLGVDRVIVLKFTRRLSRLRPERFLKDILIKRIGMKEIFVSDNFYFGRGARAGVKALRHLAKGLNFRVHLLKPVKALGRIVSSSRIRRLIVAGDIDGARRLLGRPVSILGTVVRGRGRGRFLGFPTANIDPHHEVIPPSGVYAVKIRRKGRLYKGILNIGFRPTVAREVDSNELAIEAHILNFNMSIYGEDLEILFIRRLRAEKIFKDEAGLAAQIADDAGRAGRIL